MQRMFRLILVILGCVGILFSQSPSAQSDGGGKKPKKPRLSEAGDPIPDTDNTGRDNFFARFFSPHFEDKDIAELIDVGGMYKSRIDYQNRALAEKRIPLQQTKREKGAPRRVEFKKGKRGAEPVSVTFFGDRDVIAALVADGNANLHTATIQELQKVPKTGLLFAQLNLSGPPFWVQRYGNGGAKVVLEIAGRFIEPVRSDSFPRVQSTGCTETTYLWSVFGTYRFGASAIIPITTSCDPTGPDHVSLEFAFQVASLSPETIVRVAFGALGAGTEFISSPVKLGTLTGFSAQRL